MEGRRMAELRGEYFGPSRHRDLEWVDIEGKQNFHKSQKQEELTEKEGLLPEDDEIFEDLEGLGMPEEAWWRPRL